MKIPNFLLLGSLLLSFSALAADEAQADKLGNSPGGKAIEKLLEGKDKSKTPANMDFNGAALEAQYAKEPGFASDSVDQKARDKVVEASQAKFTKKSSDHVQALYKCSKIGDLKAAKECRSAEATPKKSKK